METLEYYECLVREKFFKRLSELHPDDFDEDDRIILEIMYEVVEMWIPLYSSSILSIAASYPPLAKSKCES